MTQPTQEQYLNVLKALKWAYEKLEPGSDQRKAIATNMTAFRGAMKTLFGPDSDASVPTDKMFSELGLTVDWSGLSSFATQLAQSPVSSTVDQFQINLGRFISNNVKKWQDLGSTPVPTVEQKAMQSYVGQTSDTVNNLGKPINQPTVIKTPTTTVTVPSAIPEPAPMVDQATAETVVNAGIPENKFAPGPSVGMPAGTPPASTYFGTTGGKGTAVAGPPAVVSATAVPPPVVTTVPPEPGVDPVIRDWKPGTAIPEGYTASGNTIVKAAAAEGTNVQQTAMQKFVQNEYFKAGDFDGYLLSMNPMWKQYAVTDPATGKVTLDKTKIKASGDSQVYQAGLGLWNEIVRLSDKQMTGTTPDQVINSPYYKAQVQVINLEIDGAIKAMNIKLNGQIAALEGQQENVKTNAKYALQQLQRELGVTNWTSRQNMGVSGIINTGMLAYVYGQAAGNTAMQAGKIAELSYNDLNTIGNQIAILEGGKTDFASDQELLRTANEKMALLALIDPTNTTVQEVSDALGQAVAQIDTLATTGNLVAAPINTAEAAAATALDLSNTVTLAEVQASTGLKITLNPTTGKYETTEQPTALQIGQMAANGWGWDAATKSWTEKPTTAERQKWAATGWVWDDTTKTVTYDLSKDTARLDMLRDAGWLGADGKIINDPAKNAIIAAGLLASGIKIGADGKPYFVTTPALSEQIRSNKVNEQQARDSLTAQMTAAGWVKDAKGKWGYTGAGQKTTAGAGVYDPTDDRLLAGDTNLDAPTRQAAAIRLALGTGAMPADDNSFIGLLSGADRISFWGFVKDPWTHYSFKDSDLKAGLFDYSDTTLDGFLGSIQDTDRGIEATILKGIRDGEYANWIEGMLFYQGLDKNGMPLKDAKGKALDNLYLKLGVDPMKLQLFFNKAYKAKTVNYMTYKGTSFDNRLPWGPAPGY